MTHLKNVDVKIWAKKVKKKIYHKNYFWTHVTHIQFDN